MRIPKYNEKNIETLAILVVDNLSFEEVIECARANLINSYKADKDLYVNDYKYEHGLN